MRRRKDVLDKEKKEVVVFKFSIDKNKYPDIVVYLQGIKNKNRRGEWITQAVKLYKDLEVSLGTVDFEFIRNFIEKFKSHFAKDLINKTNKN